MGQWGKSRAIKLLFSISRNSYTCIQYIAVCTTIPTNGLVVVVTEFPVVVVFASNKDSIRVQTNIPNTRERGETVHLKASGLEIPYWNFQS